MMQSRAALAALTVGLFLGLGCESGSASKAEESALSAHDVDGAGPRDAGHAGADPSEAGGSGEDPGAAEDEGRTEDPGAVVDDARAEDPGAVDDDGAAEDPGTVEDDGAAEDPGTVEDDGAAEDPGTVEDDGAAEDPGTVEDDGAAEDPGTVEDDGAAEDAGTVDDDGAAEDPGTVEDEGHVEDDVATTDEGVDRDDGYEPAADDGAPPGDADPCGDCDDGDPCTADTCDATGGCASEADCSICSEREACDLVWTWQGAGLASLVVGRLESRGYEQTMVGPEGELAADFTFVAEQPGVLENGVFARAEPVDLVNVAELRGSTDAVAGIRVELPRIRPSDGLTVPCVRGFKVKLLRLDTGRLHTKLTSSQKVRFSALDHAGDEVAGETFSSPPIGDDLVLRIEDHAAVCGQIEALAIRFPAGCGCGGVSFLGIESISLHLDPSPRPACAARGLPPGCCGSPLVWPTTGTSEQTLASSTYGPREQYSRDGAYDWHQGVDLPGHDGDEGFEDPVFAVAAGEIARVGNLPGDGSGAVAGYSEASGNLLILRHDEEHVGLGLGTFYSLYLHLDEVDLAEHPARLGGELGPVDLRDYFFLDGADTDDSNRGKPRHLHRQTGAPITAYPAFEQGDVIAHIGDSGSSIGFEHLHFEIRHRPDGVATPAPLSRVWARNPYGWLPLHNTAAHEVAVRPADGGPWRVSVELERDTVARGEVIAGRQELDVERLLVELVDDGEAVASRSFSFFEDVNRRGADRFADGLHGFDHSDFLSAAHAPGEPDRSLGGVDLRLDPEPFTSYTGTWTLAAELSGLLGAGFAPTCGQRLRATAYDVCGLAVSAESPAVDCSPAPMRVSIPFYVYPRTWEEGTEWDDVAGASLRLGLVVINPESGPGEELNDDYAKATADLDAAHVTMLGYVSTAYGARPVEEVTAEALRYYAFYPVSGIFLDETPGTADCEPLYGHYRSIVAAIRTADPSAIVAMNPGTDTCESYLDLADVLLLFEDDAESHAAWTPPAWTLRYPARRFWHLVHGASEAQMRASVARARAGNVGHVYVTSDELPNPWDSLPEWWGELLTETAR